MVSFAKMAVSKEVREHADRLDAAKTPEERDALYKSYQKANHADRNSAGLRALKGAATASLLAGFVDNRVHNLINGVRMLTKSPGGRVDLLRGKRNYAYPAIALAGASLGLLNKKGPRSVASLEAHYAVKKGKKDKSMAEKAAGLPESKYWPLGDMYNAFTPETTVADLNNPHMNDATRKRIMRAGVSVRSHAKGPAQAFTAGGRSLSMRGKIPVEDRPSILAHELGHHERSHLSKRVLVGTPALFAGMVTGASLGHKLLSGYKGGKYSHSLPHIGAIAAGGAAGARLARKSVDLLMSERAERQADRTATELTGAHATKRALTNIHREGHDAARKDIMKETKGKPGYFAKRKLKALDAREKEHFERPATRTGRAWSRIKHGAGSAHPPLWSRLESIDKYEKAQSHKQPAAA